MKLYNNSQKTPQSESLHKVKQNWKTPHQKMKVYTANITVSRLAVTASDMAGKNTPNSSTRLQRKFPHTKYSSRQLIYTKATRIFLQHQILILYTALFLKGQCGFLSVSLERFFSSLSHRRELEFRVWGVITRAHFFWWGIAVTGALRCSAGNGFCFVVSSTRLTIRWVLQCCPFTEFPDTFVHLWYFHIIRFDLLSALIG